MNGRDGVAGRPATDGGSDSGDAAATRIGIVGAGAAGAAAAYALRGTDATVTILEKSRGVCGRAATRRKHGCRYDHGANYIKDGDDLTASLIPELGADGLVDIAEPVWTFDAEGTVSEGHGDDGRKWTWSTGITQLAKRLLDRTDATVHKETRVESIERTAGETWTVTDTDGAEHGPFDALLLTPPAPQTAELLRATAWDDTRLGALADAVAAVPFRTIRTLVLHYPFRESYPWYGLVNVDKEHDIGWLSREECKTGHVPDGESLLIAQMSPAWSSAHYDDPVADAARAAADRVATLLDDGRYRDPDWIDDQGWRYALPDGAVDGGPLDAAAAAGLHVAGDWVAGEGRVAAALRSGHRVGERIRDGAGAGRT
jgi:predicted NAD/FAD-dependent oxidoreductase